MKYFETLDIQLLPDRPRLKTQNTNIYYYDDFNGEFVCKTIDGLIVKIDLLIGHCLNSSNFTFERI